MQYSQGSLGFSLLFPFYLCCFAWGNGAEMGLVKIINVPVPTKIDHLPHPNWQVVEGCRTAFFPLLSSFSFLFSSLFLSSFSLFKHPEECSFPLLRARIEGDYCLNSFSFSSGFFHSLLPFFFDFSCFRPLSGWICPLNSEK